jgi:hypothetical protein
MPEINELPPTPGVVNSDLFATKKGGTDYRASVLQVFETIASNLTGQQIMDLVQMVDTNNSGLNANFLQGATRAFLQNASNLNDGTVSPDRLPTLGRWTTGFGMPNTGALTFELRLPPWLFSGLGTDRRVMLYGGITGNMFGSQNFTIPFPQNMTGGILSGDQKFVMAVPISPSQNGGVDVRAHSVTTSSFQLRTHPNTRQTTQETVRAGWLVIGTHNL